MISRPSAYDDFQKEKIAALGFAQKAMETPEEHAASEPREAQIKKAWQAALEAGDPKKARDIAECEAQAIVREATRAAEVEAARIVAEAICKAGERASFILQEEIDAEEAIRLAREEIVDATYAEKTREEGQQADCEEETGSASD